jgi:hypothetical protein
MFSSASVRAVGIALLAFVCGCSSAPEISIPQIEGARRVVEEPRQDRAKVYQACLRDALDPPPGDKELLISCMRDQRYGFLAETAPHRIEHCLDMRNTEGKFPEEFCFQKLK